MDNNCSCRTIFHSFRLFRKEKTFFKAIIHGPAELAATDQTVEGSNSVDSPEYCLATISNVQIISGQNTYGTHIFNQAIIE